MRLVGSVSRADTVSRRTQHDVLMRIRGSDGQLFDATLTTRSGGELWVSVDGTDLRQVAARISAVCDALYLTQPSRLEAAPDAVAPTNSSPEGTLGRTPRAQPASNLATGRKRKTSENNEA
jgi:hypothetical protein